MKKTKVQNPDGDQVEVEEFPPFYVHPPLGGGKGYVVTHAPDWRCVARLRLVTDARAAARSLAWLWEKLEGEDLAWLVERLRHKSCCDVE